MTAPKHSKKYLSTALIAASLLLATDAFYSLAHTSSKEDRFRLDSCDILNVLKAYRDEAKTPDVALLGSSLIEVPSIEAAAIAANKPVDRLTHHRCDYLEKELGNQLGTKPTVVSLAVGGEMVSDAFLIAKRLLIGARAPRAIIYGIGPRDFQDNLMPGINSSDTFKLLSAIDDVPDVWQAKQLSAESKLALTIENLSGLCGNRSQIASATNQSITNTMSSLLPQMKKSWSDTPTKTTLSDERAKSALLSENRARPTNIQTFIGGMISPGEAVWHPGDEYMLQNYLSRYNPVAPEQIKTQLSYFERLIRLCRERKTPLMIVNMPLGEINRRVMAPGFYEKFLSDTQKICREQGVPYVDLNIASLNSKENFLDTVHLNPTGSAKFFSTMSKTIDPAVVVALTEQNKSLAAKTAETY
jgi:hypothetical protein